MDFSSSSTSSSPRYKMSRNWLGNRYDPEPEDDKEATVTAAAAAASEAKSSGVDSDSTLEHRSSASDSIEKEHMFDKVVTPSDVGKLNRLVIPKQHAEKYFPLDSSTNEKGLLLNFEDRNGKPWRFRYSYWNSSQSYVMTKGWSRFVKDKKLDAGDIVSFLKGTGELGKDRFFIDWRQRHDALETQVPFHSNQQHHFSLHRSIPWSPLLMRPRPPPPPTNGLYRNSYYGGYPSGSNVVNTGGSMGSVFYLRSVAPQMGMMGWQQQGRDVEPVAFDSVPVVKGKAAAKRLRLFGVNMDCPISESDVISAATIANTPMASRPLYNGAPLSPTDFLNPNKGKASMSLNFDIRPQRSTDLA